MSDMLFVKPSAGLIVRDPITRRAIPAFGRAVPRTPYWLRRLRDGDAEETSAKAIATAAAEAASKPSLPEPPEPPEPPTKPTRKGSDKP